MLGFCDNSATWKKKPSKLMAFFSLYKLSNHRCLRDFLIRHRRKVMDEMQKPMRFRVGRTILRNTGKDSLGVVAHDGELQQIGRVEHHVGILLEWIHPLLLGGEDVGPLLDGLTGREGTLVVITNDAAQQTVVAGRNDVVVVQRSAG